MSGSFDPVSGRPTGSAPTAGSKGTSLPTGTAIRDQRNSARGRGRWVTVTGLVVGLGLIAVGLIPRQGNDSPAEAAADPTTTTVPPTTTTTVPPTTTVTTTTTTTTPAIRTVKASTGIEYDAPGDWTPVDRYALNGKPATYATLTDATEDLADSCAYQPSGTGLYTDDSAGATATTASEYARGLANIAFGSPKRNPDTTVGTPKDLSGPGWVGHEVVVRATLTDPLDCGLSEGVVAVVALTTEAEPTRTVVVAAFGGTTTDKLTEDSARTIVESVRVSD